jgi:hypothetical protein
MSTEQTHHRRSSSTTSTVSLERPVSVDSALDLPDAFPDVVQTKTAHIRSGDSVTYRTRLLGIDETGAAVYHDEANRQVIRVVKESRYLETEAHSQLHKRTRGVRPSPVTDHLGTALYCIDATDVPIGTMQEDKLLHWVGHMADSWLVVAPPIVELAASREYHCSSPRNDLLHKIHRKAPDEDTHHWFETF